MERMSEHHLDSLTGYHSVPLLAQSFVSHLVEVMEYHWAPSMAHGLDCYLGPLKEWCLAMHLDTLTD